ncbi:hypothetical protein EDD22DRAFT_959743 [Suillus occidentalis]|nr:hypothetical protein EDD22DRAFT_959743 [Suillus occidentalis]
MKSLLSKNTTGGSVEAAPPTFVRLTFLKYRDLSSAVISPYFGQALLLRMRIKRMKDKTTASDERHGVFVTCGVFYVTDDCPINRKYNNAYNGSSVGVETLQIISVTQGLEETPSDILFQHDPDINAKAAFQRSQSPVSVALATLAKHCPPQLGRKTKTKRQFSSLEQESPLKITRKRPRFTSWGRPRQEEVLLSWLTHALVPSNVQSSDMPSDMHAQDKKITEDPCDPEGRDDFPPSASHVSVKRPKTACRVSLASIPEERRSFWLTRPLRTDISAQGDLQPATSPPSHSQSPPIPAARFSSVYASCFARPQRQPSVIHWKLP